MTRGNRWRAPATGSLDDDQRALLDRIVGGPRRNGPFRLREDDGSLTGPFGLMLLAPAVGSALAGLGEAIRYRSKLTERVREIAILAVSVKRQASYEWYAHERVARKFGMNEGELAALRDGNLDVWSDAAERTAHIVTCRLLERRHLEDELYSTAIALLGDDGLFELVCLVGYYEMLALAMATFGVGVPAGEPDPFA